MKKIIFLLLFVSLIFSKSYEIDEYNVEITIDENGKTTIFENIKVAFYGNFEEGWRDIPLEDIEKLENIENVWVEVNELPVPFEVENVGDARIHWYYETSGGTDRILLGFELENAVKKYNDGALFCWTLLGDSWGTTTDHLNAKITLPEGADEDQVNAKMYYPSGSGQVDVNENNIEIDVYNIASGDYVGMCLVFDKNSVDILPQNSYDGSVYDSERLKDDQGIKWYLCLGTPILGIIALIGCWLKYGKDNVKSLQPSVLPPSNISPAILPGLMNENDVFRTETIAGTIIDLISKGYLGIQELEKTREVKMFGDSNLKKDRTILILKKRDNKLNKHEKTIIDMIFGTDEKKVDLDELIETAQGKELKLDGKKMTKERKKKLKEMRKKTKKRLIANYGKFKDHITKEIKKQKFFDNSGVGIVILLGILFFFAGFIAFLFFDVYELFVGVPVAILFWLSTVVMKRRNPEWIDEYSEWKGFENAVSGTLIKENSPSSVVVWERILAYATVLGKANKVMNHMNELRILSTLGIKKLRRMDTRLHRFNRYVSAAYASRYMSRSSGGGIHIGGGTSSWSSSGGGFSSGRTGGGGFR